MKVFRNKVWRNVFLLLTGITFLNMSFFLAEIAMLKGSYDKATMENITRLFRASLSEEETDSSEAPENNCKEIDLVAGFLCHLQFENTDVIIALKTQQGLSNIHSGYLQIFTPPPDRS